MFMQNRMELFIAIITEYSLHLRLSALSFADIVRVNYIFADRDDFSRRWPALRRWFADHPPAATMIVAGLAEPDMKLEIEVTARIPNTPAD